MCSHTSGNKFKFTYMRVGYSATALSCGTDDRLIVGGKATQKPNPRYEEPEEIGCTPISSEVTGMSRYYPKWS
jgi:hypothetical protein